MTADRFRWLEFGDSAPEPESRRTEGAGGKDQHFHLQKADEHYAEGEYEPALRNYSAALKYDSGMQEAWCGQVRCMVRMGDLQQALVWGQKGLETLPHSASAFSVLGLVLARAGHPGEGLRASDTALQLCSQAGGTVGERIWVERAGLLLSCGQRENAEACFERVRATHPQDAEWLQEIGMEYFESREFPQALKIFNDALACKPDRAFLWLQVARTAHKLHLEPQARAAFDKARALKPVDPEIAREGRHLFPRKSDRPCWIATAVFEDAGHPAVQALRQWRDERMLASPLGRMLASAYDCTAPWICGILDLAPSLRAPLRRPLAWLAARISSSPEERTPP